MSGVPVICSDYCGAADMIHDGFNGELFQCDCLESLAGALEKWVSRGPLTDQKREEIRAWSECINGGAVAGYFLEILEYIDRAVVARPQAPWMQQGTGRCYGDVV
jgi:glycosyltransferase involved in cell wall biosynthesis